MRKHDTSSLSTEMLWQELKSVGIDENKIDLLLFDTVASTNTTAKEIADRGTPTLVIANGQSGGRGRLGRSFSCPDGAGIYMSLLCYPKIPASEASRLTCLCAVAAARAIDRISGIRPYIKWVNDLYIGDKKLAGILTEGSASQDGSLSYAVIGIGINVHAADLGEYSGIATSIEAAGGRPTARAELVGAILSELFPMIEAEDPTPYFTEYIERAKPMIGKAVTVIRADESYPATVAGIEKDGRLSVVTEDGRTVTLGTGEISLSLKRNGN